MEWFNAKESLPKEGVNEGASIVVLVTNGKEIGYGFYDLDFHVWEYSMAGYCQQTNGNITHWAHFPLLPDGSRPVNEW